MTARGAAWERVLEVQHDEYRRRGVACVFRTPPAVRILGDVVGGRFHASFRGEGPPDYAGVASGIGALAFDAKDCASKSWHFGGLARHQARDLEAWSAQGGAAFLAIRYRYKVRGDHARAVEVAYVVPWAWLGPRWWAWHEAEARSAETSSLAEADAGRAGYRMPTPGDWLGALR